MMGKLSPDSLAILLLSTNLAIPYKAENAPKPLTPKEWEDLSLLLRKNSLRPHIFLEKSVSEWNQLLYLAVGEVERIERLIARSGSLSLEIERLLNSGIWVTTRAEDNYPKRWKKLLSHKSPTVLYGAGDPSLLNPIEESVAIVGSRDTDEAGADFAKKVGQTCAREGLLVVSGGARGVDQLAQYSALQAGGRVVSILSEGLEPNMKKKELRDAVLAGNMLAVSAVHPRTKFTAFNAMARNKYVYAFSNYSVVVASAANKGGTWKGAVENLEAGWVPLFVRKGVDIPQGNLHLLERGGHPLQDDFLKSAEQSLHDFFRKQIEKKQERVDIFEVVWPYIEPELTSPKSEYELADTLQVQPSQLHEWLHKAETQGRVRKEMEGYISISPVHSRKDQKKLVKMEQKSLFDS